MKAVSSAADAYPHFFYFMKYIFHRCGKYSGIKYRKARVAEQPIRAYLVRGWMKMITHIVLFKFKDQEAVYKAQEMLADMEGKIPQLRYLEVGADILRSERSYDLALVSKFDSMEDLDAYQVHPVHEKVKEYILSVRESSVSVDYES